MTKLPDTFVGENETRTLFVLDGKSPRPRIRIEQGMIYDDGVFREYNHMEIMPTDTFFELCHRYWENRESVG